MGTSTGTPLRVVLIEDSPILRDMLRELLDELDGVQVVADADDEAPDALLQALGHDPVTLDALCARTGWDAAALNVRLLELELVDQVARLPGGLFQRRRGV